MVPCSWLWVPQLSMVNTWVDICWNNGPRKSNWWLVELPKRLNFDHAQKTNLQTMKHFVNLLGHFKIWLQIKCVVKCNHSVCWKSEYTKFKLKFRSIYFFIHTRAQQKLIWRIVCIYRGETEEKEREAKCLLKHTGYVWWLVHRTHKSACLFDVTNYPFDEHTCHMWFQSIEVC